MIIGCILEGVRNQNKKGDTRRLTQQMHWWNIFAR